MKLGPGPAKDLTKLPRLITTFLLATILLACQPPRSETTATPGCASSPLGTVAAPGNVDVPIRFGSRLAGPSIVNHAEGTKGQLWLYRTDEPPILLQLEAHRLNGPERFGFVLIRAGTSAPSVQWPGGGGQAFTYRPGELGRLLPSPGCWRFRIGGGIEIDEVILPAR